MCVCVCVCVCVCARRFVCVLCFKRVRVPRWSCTFASDGNTHTNEDAIPTTVLQLDGPLSRALRGLVGGVRSGARAHQGLAPFLLSSYPPPPHHYRHIDTLSVFLSSSTKVRATIPLVRGVFSLRDPSLFPLSLLFVLRGEGPICMCVCLCAT